MVDTNRTEADLLATVFQDGQADNSISAQDMRDFVVTAKYLQPIGWQFAYDGDYPDIAGARALTLLGGRTQLTLTENPGEALVYPSTAPGWWEEANDRIYPIPANSAGLVRLSFAAWQDSPNSRFELEMDVSAGGSGNVIYQDTRQFVKGTTSSNHQHFNFIIPLFAGSDFVTNGGKFYITPAVGDMHIFATTITLISMLIPNPAGEG